MRRSSALARRSGTVWSEEQTVEATEHCLGRVAPGQQIPLVELAVFDVLLGRANHDLQVLAHIGIALGSQLGPQRGARLAHGVAIARSVVRAQVDDLIVIARHTEKACVFGLERRLRIEQDLHIPVAGLHSGRASGLCRRSIACNGNEEPSASATARTSGFMRQIRELGSATLPICNVRGNLL
ncbi:hypothetical protein ACU17_02925 [Xanthomonas oryzae pv. oryzicola]|nr:hypothetical protein ACU17_02925 [Xanthomonas oryzae pv. oryzicola]